jgi:hypothetical protein
LGKDFENGGEVSEIPGAFYSGFNGESEYAIVLNPLPGEYQIKTVGTGDGLYTVVADYTDLENAHSTEVTKKVVEGQEEVHKLIFNSQTGAFEFAQAPQEEGVVVEEPPVQEEVSTGGGGGSRSSGRVLGVSTSRFTHQQVEAILALLRAFGVDENVVAKVATVL